MDKLDISTYVLRNGDEKITNEIYRLYDSPKERFSDDIQVLDRLGPQASGGGNELKLNLPKELMNVSLNVMALNLGSIVFKENVTMRGDLENAKLKISKLLGCELS